jgi:hypothetical protein
VAPCKLLLRCASQLRFLDLSQSLKGMGCMKWRHLSLYCTHWHHKGLPPQRNPLLLLPSLLLLLLLLPSLLLLLLLLGVQQGLLLHPWDAARTQEHSNTQQRPWLLAAVSVCLQDTSS